MIGRLTTPAPEVRGHGRLSVLAESLAARLPSLLVAAEHVAATVALGLHGRRRAGRGESFWQFRRYQPGDAVADIDWRRSAKADPLYVRETEWDAAQSVWLWVDGSPSMDFRSAGILPSKRERAVLLGLALATLLSRGGERVALMGSSHPPGIGRGALHRMADRLLGPTGATDNLPPDVALPRFAELVVIGDFMTDMEGLIARLTHLARHQVRGHLVQVLDPAEESLPFAGRVRFVDMENGAAMLIDDVGSVREAYGRALTEHRDRLHDIARRLGWSFAVHHTDHSPEAALLGLHIRLGG